MTPRLASHLGNLAAGLLLAATAWALAGPLPNLLQHFAAATDRDRCATSDPAPADCGRLAHAAIRVAIAPSPAGGAADPRVVPITASDSRTDADMELLPALSPAAGIAAPIDEATPPTAVTARAPTPDDIVAPDNPIRVARPAPDVSPGARSVFLIIGSYRHPDNAAALVAHFESWRPRFAIVERDGNVLHRVIAGPFPLADLPALKARAQALGVADVWALPAPDDAAVGPLPDRLTPGADSVVAQLP